MKRPSWLVALRVEGKYIGLDAGKDITKRRHPQHQVDRPLQRSFASAPQLSLLEHECQRSGMQQQGAGRKDQQVGEQPRAHLYWDSHGCRAIASTPPGKRSRPRG